MFFPVPEAGVEPAWISPNDFESFAYKPVSPLRPVSKVYAKTAKKSIKRAAREVRLGKVIANHTPLISRNAIRRTPPMIGMQINQGKDWVSKATGIAEVMPTMVATVQIRLVGKALTLLVFILIVGLLEL
jgi:hypothetical protein